MRILLKSALPDTDNLQHKSIPTTLFRFKQWSKQVQMLHYQVPSNFVSLCPLPPNGRKCLQVRQTYRVTFCFVKLINNITLGEQRTFYLLTWFLKMLSHLQDRLLFLPFFSSLREPFHFYSHPQVLSDRHFLSKEI